MMLVVIQVSVPPAAVAGVAWLQVWFMAGSLFNKYPFDLPTEAFSFDLFKQAFAAVQASIVHLQGVPLAKRFALVPLGPPLLQYSSTCKAMLSYNEATKSVQLTLDRAVPAGAPLAAWCGPQPNNRLLLNYGIVDENNPYDKLQMTVSVPTNDPLYQKKRSLLHTGSLASTQTFDLARNKPLPALLLPYMRVAFATTEQQLEKVEKAALITFRCSMMMATARHTGLCVLRVILSPCTPPVYVKKNSTARSTTAWHSKHAAQNGCALTRIVVYRIRVFLMCPLCRCCACRSL